MSGRLIRPISALHVPHVSGTSPPLYSRCDKPLLLPPPTSWSGGLRTITASSALRRESDPRIHDLGREISDDYAFLRDNYATPKNPIVLAHGLFGFSELKLSDSFPALQYWHGIRDALTAQGATVITASVPPSGPIEERAAKLAADITAQVPSPRTPVNIIAHSMGGLDARYMISHLSSSAATAGAELPGATAGEGLGTGGPVVASLVTVATPHRGSAFADYVLREGAGPLYLPRLYGALRRAGLGTGAFSQLTRSYMCERFNPQTPDREGVRYFSFGAAIDPSRSPLSPLSPFRRSHHVVEEEEGPNDGLVSVESSRWGEYRGTLVGVSHLGLINWSNRVRWTVREWIGTPRTFNAIALYLDISDMLAKEGL